MEKRAIKKLFVVGISLLLILFLNEVWWLVLEKTHPTADYESSKASGASGKELILKVIQVTQAGDVSWIRVALFPDPDGPSVAMMVPRPEALYVGDYVRVRTYYSDSERNQAYYKYVAKYVPATAATATATKK